MNESTSKKILFNKSTLVSLKAELLRKQEEVNEKKHLPQHKLVNFKPPLSKSSNKEVHKTEKKSLKDKLIAIDTDELESSRKVRFALEKKAELYEHLADSSGNSQLAGQFLVDFNNKKQIEDEYNCKHQVNDNNADKDNDRYIENEEDSNEWMEFTDCLGRTRKCLKSDLDFYQKRDKELLRSVTKSTDNEVEEIQDTTSKKEIPFLVQKTNDYLQSLRDKWEEKEKELVGKNKDIHYQDLLFDEARIHGVGYYSFSTDETERQKQMDELMKQRQETLRAQREAEESRKKRDELLEARIAAARARQRARAGLPPEEPKEKEKDFNACLLQFLTEQKNAADSKAKEEEMKVKEEKERERQKLREAHIREWDLGKDGVDDKIKKFKEMTQEEYVEQQRNKRIDEFAPPQTSSSKKSDFIFDSKGMKLATATQTNTWDDVRPKKVTSSPPDIDSTIELENPGRLYFSSSKKSNAQMKYKNFNNAQEPVPIENELSDDNNDDNRKRKLDTRNLMSNHAEIEPPPTYEYYGPNSKVSKSEKPFESNISEAYAQGARSLEHKSGARQLSKQYDFTFD